MNYKVGLIGTGAVSDLHAEAFSTVEGAELTTIADISEDAVTEKGDLWGIADEQCYLDHTEMLATESLDIVSVTTPTAFHRDHTLDAVRIGDPDVVWCEKPIATSVEAAREMVEACEETGTELVINHVRRWAKPYMKLKEEIAENNLLGDLHSVHAQFKIELLRNGTHFVDALYWILGSNAVRASGFLNGQSNFDSTNPTIDTEDYGGGGHIIFDDGTSVTLDCAVPREAFSGWFYFTGSEGRLYFNETDEQAQYWTFTEDEHREEIVDIFDDDVDQWSSAFRRAAENLVEIVDGDGVNRCPGRDAIHVQEIISSLFISHYTETTVSLPLEPPLRTVSISSW